MLVWSALFIFGHAFCSSWNEVFADVGLTLSPPVSIFLLFAAKLCGEGWSQVGESCLRINSSRESYDNARHYCKNLGGIIASLSTAKQVDFVLGELQKYQQQEKVGVACSYSKPLILHYTLRHISLINSELLLHELKIRNISCSVDCCYCISEELRWVKTFVCVYFMRERAV